MVHAIVLKLHTGGEITLPRTHGHWVHGLFLRLIEAADPDLSRRLHDMDSRKPFTVSSARAGPHPPAPSGRIQYAPTRGGEGEALYLRVTLLDDALFGPFVARFLRPGGAPLRLGTLDLQVLEVIGTRDGHPLAGYSDFDRLLDDAGRDRDLELRFATPTAFSLGASPAGKKRMALLPEPALVFDSLLRKWNEFAPTDLALDPGRRAAVKENVIVAQHRLETAMFQFPRYNQAGFVGTCRFTILSDDVGLLRPLNALADFAFYAGVGYKTTMGMGQTWPHHSSQRGGTRRALGAGSARQDKA